MTNKTKILFSFMLLASALLPQIFINENSISLTKKNTKLKNDSYQKEISEVIPEDTEIGNFKDEPNKNSILKYLENWSIVENIRLDIYQIEISSFDSENAVVRAADWASDYIRGSTVIIKLVNKNQISIKEIFGSQYFKAPCLKSVPINKNEIISALELANDYLKETKWFNLDLIYYRNGIIGIKSKELSIYYYDNFDVAVTTEIVADTENPTLKNVSDSVLITAKLGGLPTESYEWIVDIPEKYLSYFSIKKDFTSQILLITVVKQLTDIDIHDFFVFFKNTPSENLNPTQSNGILIKTNNFSNVFNIFEGEILSLTEYGKSMKEILIPEFGEDHFPITKIGKNAFFNNLNLEKVYLSKNIVQIKESAFESCANLSYISLGNNKARFETSSLNTSSNLNFNIPVEFSDWIKNGKNNLGILDYVKPGFVCSKKQNIKGDDKFYEYGSTWLNKTTNGITKSAISSSKNVVNISEFRNKKITNFKLISIASQELINLQNEINESIQFYFEDNSNQFPWYQKAQWVFAYHEWGLFQETRTSYWINYTCYFGKKIYTASIKEKEKIGITYSSQKYIPSKNWYDSKGKVDVNSRNFLDGKSSDREFCDLNWGEVFCTNSGQQLIGKIENVTWWHTIVVDWFGKQTILNPPEHRGGNERLQNGKDSIQGWMA